MKRISIFVVMIVSITSTFAQSLSLEDCYTKSRENHPLAQQNAVHLETYDLKIQNIKTMYLPTLNFSAQATYQSNVIEIPAFAPNMEMPSSSHDQYKAVLEVNQLIYDGGASRQQQELQQAQLAVYQQSTEVQLYQINERVNQVYFMILFLQEQHELLGTVAEELKTRLEAVKSGIENGVLTLSNADRIEVEILKIEQQIIEVQAGIKASKAVLSELIQEEIPEETTLAYPVFNSSSGNELARPEYDLYELQMNQVETVNRLQQTQRMPVLAAFGQLGYGKPGLNMLSDEFDTYYIVGASLQWNIWDWSKTKREKEINLLQKESISIQKQTFEMNNSIVRQQQETDIEKYRQLIEKDRAIIEVRTKVRETAAAQMEHGVITPTDYITELNAETQAKISKKLHEIKLLETQANLRVTNGLAQQ